MPRRIAVSIFLLLLGVRGLCATVSSVNVLAPQDPAVKKPSPAPTPPPDGPVPTDSGGGPGKFTPPPDGPVPTDPGGGPAKITVTLGGPGVKVFGMNTSTDDIKAIIDPHVIGLNALKAGNESLNGAIIASLAGNSDDAIQKYTTAIAHYDAGLAADPQQFVLSLNKAVALGRRGVERYNAVSQSKTLDDAGRNAALQTVKDDLKAAAEAASKGVALIKAQPVPTDPQEVQRYNAYKSAALGINAETMKVLSKIDPSYTEAGVAAFQEYLALETDPGKKAQGRLELAQMLLDAGAADKALAEFKAVLATQPDSPEANLGAGLALSQSSDKEKVQEAANYLQRFVDLTPDTNAQKADAKAKLTELKTDKSVSPEKPSNPVRKHP